MSRKLGNIGVVPVFNGDSYDFIIKGDATALTDIRGIRLVFTQFDLWGSRYRGLESTTVTDIAAGQPIPTKDSWHATENEVSRIFTTVAYVDQVILPNGKIWTANRAAVAAKLRDVQLKVTEAALDADPPKAPAAK